ncbi:MAG: hypothetical protein IJJ29_07920, partial [Solobacterium sp.]|nr:hypothetical protein [Solobacterium sp.]
PFTTQTKEMPMPPKGHTYVYDGFEWDDDYHNAYALFLCDRGDLDEPERVTARVSLTDHQEPGCEEEGYDTYTASVEAEESLDHQSHSDSMTKTLSPVGHDWNYTGFTWTEDGNGGYTATVSFTCANDPSHTTVAEAVTDFASATTPSCDEPGRIVYTAVLSAVDSPNGQEYTDEKVIETPALGHEWKYRDFAWYGNDEAGYTAEAIYVCERNNDHTMPVPAIVTSRPVEPTCEEEGGILYTAEVDAESSPDDHPRTATRLGNPIPALGHEWSFTGFSWVGNDDEGYTAAYANYACSRDDTHTLQVAMQLTSSGSVVCEGSGTMVYTAILLAANSPDGEQRTDVKIIEVQALGHDWAFSEVVWDHDDAGERTASVKYICRRDPSHQALAPMSVTVETVHEANCTEDGQLKYTAVLEEGNSYDGLRHEDYYLEDIPAFGHDWKPAGIRWEMVDGKMIARQQYLCSRNYDHKMSVLMTVTSETTEPTCTKAGKTVYTAFLSGSDAPDGIERHTSREVTIPALGHDYQYTGFEWTETADGYSAKAVYTCTHDVTHVRKADAVVTSENTAESTCEESGEIVYTAVVDAQTSIDSTEHTDAKAVTIPALGHDWRTSGVSWRTVDGEMTATQQFMCYHDQTHKQYVPMTVTSTIVDPGCTEEGKIIYSAYLSAADSPDGKSHIAEHEVPIPATGHAYGEPSYTWASDNSSVTAERVCAHDPSHKESETVSVTSVRTDAACTEAGSIVYTSASFENTAFEVQTKTVTIPATGHSWNEAVYTWSADNSRVTASRVAMIWPPIRRGLA